MGIKRKITKAKNDLTRAKHMLWNCEDILYFSNAAMSYEDEVKATEALRELEIQVKQYENLIMALENQYIIIKATLISTALIVFSLCLYVLL